MKYLTLFSIIAFSLNANAQCCPYINNIEVIPSNPTATDNVKIVTTATTPNQGLFLYSTFNVSGTTIEIDACYYSGLLTATQTYIDTLTIGSLPEGNYTIDFNAFQSTDTSVCNYSDTMSSSSNFIVQEQTNGITTLSSDVARVYPNPSAGSFKVDLNDQSINRVVIRSVSGAIVYQGKSMQQFDLRVDAGTYIVEFLEDELVRGYHRLVIN